MYVSFGKWRMSLHVRIQRGGGQWSGPPPPLKNHKNIGFHINTGPDPLKKHKATKPAFNVGPTPSRQCFAGGLRWPTFSALWIPFPLIN